MIADPLVKATTIEPFRWTSLTQTTFEQLSQAISTTPVLALSDFQLPFIVEKDASGIGMGVVLSQQGHPIAFSSKPFNQKLLRASTYVRELFAITSAMKKWHQYLLGHRFDIITDHWSLKGLLTQVIQTPNNICIQPAWWDMILTFSISLELTIKQLMLCPGYQNRILPFPSSSLFLAWPFSRNFDGKWTIIHTIYASNKTFWLLQLPTLTSQSPITLSCRKVEFGCHEVSW